MAAKASTTVTTWAATIHAGTEVDEDEPSDAPQRELATS